MARNEAERIIDSLAFEVEAVPQEVLEVSGASKSTPLNLKIKVRKKEEALFEQGVVSVPKLGQPRKSPDKIRLVSSDQTVLSFKVFVDTDPEKKPAKKRKRFFGGCLGSENNENDDDDAYVESNDNDKPGEVTKLNFGLSKNVEDMQLQSRKPTMFFGHTCKPGGCLDPPYGEDRYSYGPKVCNDIIPTENDTKLSNAATPEETIDTTVEPLDKISDNDKMKNDKIKNLALSSVISTGGVSTGGVSTGGVSTGGVSTGGVSTGGVSTGVISTGRISTGGISTGGMSTGAISTGGMSTDGMGVVSTGVISTGVVCTGVISTAAAVSKRNSIQKRSIQSIDVKPSFRDLSDLSHFSLVRGVFDKKRLTQTEYISEVSTPEDEMTITKLYPKDNDNSFQSETNSSTQDLKDNEESLATTILGVGEIVSIPLVAGVVQQETKSRKDTTNADAEKGFTAPISTEENDNILRSGDDNKSFTSTLTYPGKKGDSNSYTVKSDNALKKIMIRECDEDIENEEEDYDVGEKNNLSKSDQSSKNKKPRDLQITSDILLNGHDPHDQKFESSGDVNDIPSENYALGVKLPDSINYLENYSSKSDLSDLNKSSIDEINENGKTSNKNKKINADELTQGDNISNDSFKTNEDSKDLVKDEKRNKNITGAKSNVQPEGELTIDTNYDKHEGSQEPKDLIKISDEGLIKTLPDKFGMDDENIFQQSELQVLPNIIETKDKFGKEHENTLITHQPKSLEVDTHDVNDTNKIDTLQKQDLYRLNNPEIEKSLSSSAAANDNMNLKVDFIDDSSVMNNEIDKLKDKEHTDSILNSQERSKFRVKKDFINMNLAFQSYTNDQNESVIKSLDNINNIKREPQDNVTIIKSQLRIDAPNVIKVPIDTRNYMTLEVRASDHQISSQTSSRTPEEAAFRILDKPASTSRAVSTGSEKPSSILDDISKESVTQGNFSKVPSQKQDVETFQNLLSTVYDHQLIPLHRLISGLKTDVDKLASEQLWLKENCRRMRRPAKLTHSSRKCGCSRKLL